jgi:mono/diheme cytochrome c family protein
MKTLLTLVAASLLSILFAGTAQAADAARGETLHNSQCVACHAARFGNNGSEIYTRENRRVRDLAGLHRQVNRCKNNLEITWFDEDVADVVEYLNHTYYRFEQ